MNSQLKYEGKTISWTSYMSDYIIRFMAEWTDGNYTISPVKNAGVEEIQVLELNQSLADTLDKLSEEGYQLIFHGGAGFGDGYRDSNFYLTKRATDFYDYCSDHEIVEDGIYYQFHCFKWIMDNDQDCLVVWAGPY